MAHVGASATFAVGVAAVAVVVVVAAVWAPT
jgi:hypothetical protein